MSAPHSCMHLAHIHGKNAASSESRFSTTRFQSNRQKIKQNKTKQTSKMTIVFIHADSYICIDLNYTA